VELEDVVADEDQHELQSMLKEHAEKTGSTVATGILENWETSLANFVKVMPTDYKRVLLEQAAKEAQGNAQAESTAG
ncbi:MAG: hypothetical protein AAGG44_21190, partial [Planctomycetota bacterium]